ncbi:MAG: ATP-binding protein [Oxalobacteraceae bacterium]|nr:ATP-binding protein [Oxalobacteraceae bacterium]
MKLQIERPYAEAMIVAFPQLAGMQDQLRFGDKVELRFRQLSDAQIGFLGNLYRQAGPAMQGRAAQLATLQQALNDDGTRFTAANLEMVVPAIARFLMTGAIRGWLFTAHVTSKPLPYVVTRLDFTPSSNDESGKVFIDLKANAKGALAPVTIRISESDVVHRTVSEIFVAKGFLKETPELIAAYDESILATRALTLDATGDILGHYLDKAAKSNRYDAEDEVKQLQATRPKGLFSQLPVHPYILMFHLDLHHYLWVHADDMQPYRYQPELKQKLILPQEQTDLIDILTAEMDLLMDDIVAGKSGGTTVLCAGPPGVGKTLTAEVYSEIIRRPLYRVHSGQLGLNVAAMESALKDVLTRAQHWGAVMLIDEADVYIKRRDDNIAMNAVVGVFLRVLEYFNGLLFLTTNRVDDIDEAIVSRCIAMIKFSPPDGAARRQIWQVMTAQFELVVEHALIEQLVESFPAASGRDIKGLSKLVAKFCHQKKLAPTLEAFQRCSVFRGMDIVRLP